MKTLLHIDASVRRERSLSRRLSNLFVETWLENCPGDHVIKRDVGLQPPPFVTESWIAAVFTPEADRSATAQAELAVSDELIAEIVRADVIVLGTPMYNYGMPAPLKAWFDQVIRVNLTFSFDLARGDFPLEPTMSGKTLVILSASGEFGFGKGGVREASNHLDTHLGTCAHYLGVSETHHVAIEYQEFGDERHARSVDAAHVQAADLARQLSRQANAVPKGVGAQFG